MAGVAGAGPGSIATAGVLSAAQPRYLLTPMPMFTAHRQTLCEPVRAGRSKE